MKRSLGGVKPSFAFKKEQRSELLRVLPKRSKKDQEAANRFIDAARGEVEIFLFDVTQFITYQKQHREKLKQLAEAARKLRAALDDIPADTGASLHAEVFSTLWCDPFKHRHLHTGLKLKKLGVTDPCDGDFLEGLLDVVEESASRAASKQKVRTKAKPENRLMIGLTAKLIRHYCECFQKKPKAGNGSNFRNFMSELSTILPHDFGAETVKDAKELVEKVRKEFATSSEK